MQLQQATRARINSLHITLSTGGFSQGDHIGFEQYQYAKRVLEHPEIDERFYPCIYECPNETGNEWREPEQWRKANPSCDITFNFRSLQDEYKGVLNNPKNEIHFRTLSLNQWLASAAAPWLRMDEWNKGKQPFNESDLYGMPAYVGIDLSMRHDWCVYVIAVPVGDLIYLIPRAFVPDNDIVEKERRDKFLYRYHAKQGQLTLTPGALVDMQVFRQALLADMKHYKVKDIGFDPWGSEDLRLHLQYEHSYQLTVVPPTIQGMAPAIGYMERLVKDNKLRHNSPLLDYCVGNTRAKVDNDNSVKLVKQEENLRIDLAVCSCIALSRHFADPSRFFTSKLFVRL